MKQTRSPIEIAFDEWWEKEGKYIDPDTEDVDWFDKRRERRELCVLAFIAGNDHKL